jgi:hypothetical protein
MEAPRYNQESVACPSYSPPDPRTSAKGAWLRALNRHSLEPRPAVLNWVPLPSWREAEQRWTERFIKAGHQQTNGECRSFGAREREEESMRNALVNSRCIAAVVGISS